VGNLIDGGINVLEANAVKLVIAEDSIEVVLGIAAKIDPDPAGRSGGCSVTMRSAAGQKRQATDSNPQNEVRYCWLRELLHRFSQSGNFRLSPSITIEMLVKEIY
jgi:hypothetical protein